MCYLPDIGILLLLPLDVVDATALPLKKVILRSVGAQEAPTRFWLWYIGRAMLPPSFR